MDIGWMILAGALIILLVRFGLCVGIDHVASARAWSTKTRGQVTGLATSVPEFVCLVATGLSGVWEAGLWNIASSNVINCGLMLAAVVVYRQVKDLFHKRFLDEIIFALLAVTVPMVLMKFALDRNGIIIPVLALFFVVYRWVDRRANTVDARNESQPSPGDQRSGKRLQKGLLFIGIGLLAIIFVGNFVGMVTERVVTQMGVPAVLAGCILGLVTSLPELTTFFAIYSKAKKRGQLHKLDDTQEVLDNLTSSNMANVGVVYPIGLAVYLLVTMLR